MGIPPVLRRLLIRPEGQAGIDGGVVAVQTKFVGMMQYDGDLKLPARFLVPPPAISGVSGRAAGPGGRHHLRLLRDPEVWPRERFFCLSGCATWSAMQALPGLAVQL